MSTPDGRSWTRGRINEKERNGEKKEEPREREVEERGVYSVRKERRMVFQFVGSGLPSSTSSLPEAVWSLRAWLGPSLRADRSNGAFRFCRCRTAYFRPAWPRLFVHRGKIPYRNEWFSIIEFQPDFTGP